jgi:hypothetical protein
MGSGLGAMSGFVIELGFLIGLFAGGLAIVLMEDLAIGLL